MNKLFTKIAGLTLGLAMAIGVGVSLANEKESIFVKAAGETTVTWNATSGALGTGSGMNAVGKTATGTISTAAQGGTPSYTWNYTRTVTKLNTSNSNVGFSSPYIQLGSNNSTEDIVFTTSTIPGSIKSVTVIAYSNGGHHKLTVDVAGTKYANAASIRDSAPSSISDATYTAEPTGAASSGTITISISDATARKAMYIAKIEVVYVEADPDAPSIDITNTNKLAPHGVGRIISGSITNNDSYTITWTCPTDGVTISPSTSSSGDNVTVTVSNSVAIGTKITITATLNDVDETFATTWFRVSSKAANNVANALTAGEAYTLVNNGDIDGLQLYVKGYANNSGAKYVWLSDNEDTTKTFEVYNADGLSSYTQGTFIVAHGAAKKYNANTMEIENASVDGADYFAIKETEVEVDNTQYIDVEASNATGNITWDTTPGTGSVTLSNKTNDGVRITGTSVGTATVTATVGNLTRTISVTVNPYADDWTFKDIVLETITGFKTAYYINETLDVEHLTVTYVEHSNTLDNDRQTVLDNNDVTFNFDSSSPKSFNLTATYSGHVTDDLIGITILKAPAVINFGNTTGHTQINNTSTTGDDSEGNEWTITSEFSGTTSFSQNKEYSQIGASGKVCDKVTFTVTLESVVYVESFSAKFGAFSGDAGDITLKVGNKTVGSGSLDGTNDVVVSANTFTIGKTLTIEVTDMTRLKAYYISYESSNDSKTVDDCFVNQFLHMSDYDPTLSTKGIEVVEPYGQCATYYPVAKAMWNSMSEAQRNYFVDNSDVSEDYHDAYERLNAWASANSDKFNGDNELVAKASALIIPLQDNNGSSTTLIIVITSSMVLLTVAGYFFIRRRKENN